MNFFRMKKFSCANRFYSDLVIMKAVVLTIKIPPRTVCNEGTSPSRKSANTIAHTGSRPAMSMLTV